MESKKNPIKTLLEIFVILLMLVGVFLLPVIFKIPGGCPSNKIQILISQKISENELNDYINNINLKQLEFAIFEKINEERQKNNLEPLKWNEKIAKAARLHSKDMAENNFQSHQSSDCKTFEDRLKTNDIFYTKAAENIIQMPMIEKYEICKDGEIFSRKFKNFYTLVNETIEDWMKSENHRKNILTKDFDETGIGIALQHVPQKLYNKTATMFISTGRECPILSKPNKEATLFITQVFISTKCPENTILCNDKCWEKCPEGREFVCTSEGGTCKVISQLGCPPNTIYCNGKCWERCPPGYIFYCTAGGGICM